MELQATVNAWDVAQSVALDDDLRRDNYRGLLSFVVDIDDTVNDLQFTKALRDRLTEIIDLEEE